MKKMTFFAGAALMLALVCPGCSGDDFSQMEPTTGDSGNTDAPQVEGGIRTLKAGMPQFGGPQSRASFGPEGEGTLPVYWDAGDRIIAFETAGEYAAGHAYRLVGEGGSGNGTFEYAGGQTPPGTVAEIFYPEALAAAGFAVPAEQTYAAGSFDPAANVMRAAVSDPAAPVVFESLTSIACLRLTGSGERVTSVRLDLTSTGGAKRSHTLACPGGVELSAEPVSFHIAVEGSAEPCDAAFTVAVDGVETMLRQTTAPKTFAAATVVRLPVVAYAKNLYRVNDYWPDDTAPEGVVFSVSNGGLHGVVISHQEKTGNWGPKISEKNGGVTQMREEPEDGMAVTKELLGLRRGDAAFATNYPMFDWLLNTKNGGDIDGVWYAPSRPELRALYLVMCGMDPADHPEWTGKADNVALSGFDSADAKAARNAFKEKLDAVSGANALNLYGRLYSVYENGAGDSVWSIQLDQGIFRVMPKDGGQYSRIRPVRRF